MADLIPPPHLKCVWFIWNRRNIWWSLDKIRDGNSNGVLKILLYPRLFPQFWSKITLYKIYFFSIFRVFLGGDWKPGFGSFLLLKCFRVRTGEFLTRIFFWRLEFFVLRFASQKTEDFCWGIDRNKRKGPILKYIKGLSIQNKIEILGDIGYKVEGNLSRCSASSHLHFTC